MAAATSTIVKGAEESGSFFTRMPWYYQMGLLMLLVGLLIYATDALLYSDTRTETAKMNEDVQGLKAKNAQGSIIRQNLAATEQTLTQKREEMERLRDLLPDQVEISRVYDNIKDFLRTYKLDLRQFAQDKPESAEFYTAQKILVQVSGSYDNLGQFFSQMGFYKRIVSVTEVEVKQAEDGAQSSGRSINSSFVVTAFYIAPENLEKLTMKKPAAAPADKPGAPQPNQPK